MGDEAGVDMFRRHRSPETKEASSPLWATRLSQMFLRTPNCCPPLPKLQRKNTGSDEEEQLLRCGRYSRVPEQTTDNGEAANVGNLGNRRLLVADDDSPHHDC